MRREGVRLFFMTLQYYFSTFAMKYQQEKAIQNYEICVGSNSPIFDEVCHEYNIDLNQSI